MTTIQQEKEKVKTLQYVQLDPGDCPLCGTRLAAFDRLSVCTNPKCEMRGFDIDGELAAAISTLPRNVRTDFEIGLSRLIADVWERAETVVCENPDDYGLRSLDDEPQRWED